MQRRNFIQTGALAIAALTLIGRFDLSAKAAAGMIGKLTPEEFAKINAKALAKVSALEPTSDKLSEADQALMLEVAAGGMMQLEVSQIALKNTQSADVKALAEAEVVEQSGLSAKLKAIAKAKGVTLPSEPDATTKKMVAMLKKKSGAELDKMYLEKSGVEGHEKLQATMMKVQAQATDPLLKKLATTTLPLIKTHLQVARDEMSDMA